MSKNGSNEQKKNSLNAHRMLSFELLHIVSRAIVQKVNSSNGSSSN